MSVVYWPPGFEVEGAPVHTVNELEMDAPVERVWAWLVRAPLWPSFYGNCKRVVIEHGTTESLDLGTVFSWTTFGIRVRTTVEEFVVNERLAWSGVALGSRGFHAWVLETRASGCRVVTEEVQRGWVPAVGRVWLRRALLREHQNWLEGLARVARDGMPPRAAGT